MTQRAWLLFAAVMVLSAESSGQMVPTGPRLRLIPMATGARSAAPISVEIKLEYNEPQVLEGDLVLEIYDSEVVANQLLGTVTYEAIALYDQDYIFRTTLPPLEHSRRGQYQIVAWFQTANNKISLSPDWQDPRAPHEILTSDHIRSFAIANISAHDRVSRRRAPYEALNRSLEFEQDGVPVYHSRWDPGDWPEDPLRHCSYDVVTSTGTALSELTDKQLTGLQQWVAAGGSLVLQPDETLLEERHRRFLIELFRRSNPAVVIPVTGNFAAVLEEEAQRSPVLSHYELGRAILAAQGDLSRQLSAQQLNRVRNHLWKLRSDWEKPDRSRYEQNYSQWNQRGDMVLRRNQLYMGSISSQPERSDFSQICSDVLMPTDVQTVPAPVVLTLLLSYILLVGPVDYIALGLIGRRKWTWILFPVVTAVYTWAAIEISHNYLASESNGKSIAVVDIGSEGQVLRQSKFELFFMGADMPIHQTGRRSFTVPIHDEQGESILNLSGRFPQSYASQQDARQWQPLLRRIMSIGPTDDSLPSLPWKQLTDGTAGNREFIAAVNSIRPHADRVWLIVANAERERTLYDSGPKHDIEDNEWKNSPTRRGWMTKPNFGAVASMTVHNYGNGFMAVAEQVSPQGSASCEDLFLLSSDNLNEYVLMAVVEYEDRILVLRQRIDGDAAISVSQGQLP